MPCHAASFAVVSRWSAAKSGTALQLGNCRGRQQHIASPQKQNAIPHPGCPPTPPPVPKNKKTTPGTRMLRRTCHPLHTVLYTTLDVHVWTWTVCVLTLTFQHSLKLLSRVVCTAISNTHTRRSLYQARLPHHCSRASLSLRHTITRTATFAQCHRRCRCIPNIGHLDPRRDFLGLQGFPRLARGVGHAHT